MAGYGLIGFLTDYGLDDHFVAVCHGVMAAGAPHARVVDITHLVPPQDVHRGAVVLADAVPWFPPAVFVAVVDPGVGTRRRAVAVEAAPAPHKPGEGAAESVETSVLVGPDNGLLSWAWEALGGVRRVVAIPGEGVASATFHGRDVFAPAAAMLAAGADLEDVGDPVDPGTLVRLPQPYLSASGVRLEVEVLTVDRFGNVQLAARAADAWHTWGPDLPAHVDVTAGAGRRTIRFGRTFADVATGELVALVDSSGRLALAVNGGSASDVLQTRAGDRLTLEPAAG